jgi:hypothetical protein
MKKNHIIALLAAAILVAGIITAGCTQDSGSSASPTGNSQQYTPSGGQASTPAVDSASQVNSTRGGQQYTQSSGGHQSGGQNFLTNETLIAAAAGKLGVSGQDLQNALNSTKNATSGRPNLTAAAQQLGVTQQQLTDALGFSASGRIRSGGYNATRTPAQ